MKGLAIHMEQLIIIIVCIIVLLAIVAFFFGLWNPGVLLYQAKLRQACSVMQNNGCQSQYISPVNVDSGIKGKEIGRTESSTISVYVVCEKILGANKDLPKSLTVRCLEACGCVTA